jgi:drug/metabolite transporter (DMT)-like permease
MSIGRQLTVVGLMLALAAIDFIGALVAQDYAERRRPSALLFGCGLSILLFAVYAVALRYADLSIVTMGWIVLLQVALVLTDVLRHRLQLSWAQWAAASLILVLQVYLVASTDKQADVAIPYPAGKVTVEPVAQTSTTLTAPGRSPVTRNTTLRATDTAWSANRS